MEIQNITFHFFNSAKSYPDKIAIRDGLRSCTYGELSQDVLRTITHYHNSGIRKGDRVFVFEPMGIDLYRCVLALFGMGATAVFIDEWAKTDRLVTCSEMAQCKALIGRTKVRILSWFFSSFRKIPVYLHPSSMAQEATPILDKLNDDHPALITFTTGSTGVPKAAIRTHGLLQAQFEALQHETQPRPHDICLTTLPIVLLLNLGIGCTSIISRFNSKKPLQMKPEEVITLLSKEKVNRLIASPYFIEIISKQLIKVNQRLTELTNIFTGGAPVFTSDAQLFTKAFPNSQIQLVYGSTEAEPISLISAELLGTAQQSEEGLPVGKISDYTQCKIIKITTSPIVCNDQISLSQWEVNSGEIGEIIVSGPHVLRNYLGNPEAENQNKILIEDQCWHRTGDSGYKGEDGNLYLTGRCESLIYLDKTLVSPFLYEQAFKNMAGINIGTILLLEGTLTAIIEPVKNNPLDQLTIQIKGEFPKIKKVIFLDKIPRDPRHFSKIDYGSIRSLIPSD
jgi:olefin beta-lactone synthetase